jgi:hypothetical protein
MAEIIEIQQEVDFFRMDWYDPTYFAIEILDAKYEKVQIKDVVNPLEYLSTQQRADLKQVLSEFTKLFGGTLGVYPHTKSTLNWNHELSQDMLDHTLFHLITWKPLKRVDTPLSDRCLTTTRSKRVVFSDHDHTQKRWQSPLDQ